MAARALGNSIWKGKGTETNKYVLFMSVPNRHEMTASFAALNKLVVGYVADSGWLSSLQQTRWMEHLSRILAAASKTAFFLFEKGISQLIHCSQGWDRTPQARDNMRCKCALEY